MSRTSLRLAAPTAGLLTLSLAACAQTGGTTGSETASDYPTKPIELLVGFDAGGSTDIGARMMAQELEKKLDATISVVNRPGANSQTAYTALTQAEPDGYTMAAATFPSAIITVLDESRGASYGHEDFAPVALQTVDPTAVAVAPESDIQTPEDLVTAAEAAPGKLRATTTGVASNEHFALAQLEDVTGIDIAPVHFADGGEAAATAFLGGNVELLVGNVSDLQSVAETGKARIVGVMEGERSPFLPDVPTFTEAGYDVELSSSRGYVFPAGTPEEIVTQVSDAIGEIMQDPAFEKQMTDQGFDPTYMNAEQYAQYWDETTELFTDLYPLVREEK